MSMALMRSECRKFAPNIFNKSKCTNCFRQKEEHSAEALESNRATRKVAKCGYLFVAPGWDFTNPLNRTKRWQRRWFVLYDDGELSYSVDEHPETVPQASIDMNKVLEVSDAETVTGNAFSLAITAPDSVTFVKGTCREECRWWGDVLKVFPRSKGRHKRTATLPGALGGMGPGLGASAGLSQSPAAATSPVPQPASKSLSTSGAQSAPLRVSSSVSDVRTRFGGWDSDGLSGVRPLSLPLQDGGQDDARRDGVVDDDDDDEDDDDDDDVFPTRDVVDAPSLPASFSTISTPADARKVPVPPSQVHASLHAPVYRDQPASSGSPPTRDKIASEDKNRTRRAQQGLQHGRDKREHGLKAGRSFSEDFASILPSWREAKLSPDSRDEKEEAARRVLFREIANECKRGEKLKDIAASITRTRSSRTSCGRAGAQAASQLQPTRDGDGGKQVRGDPDGCGLDVSTQRYSPSSELRVDLPAEDLLNIKKGWLMKQGASKEWNKHWFVLRGAALMYYRDPTSEDKGLLDGVIDLSAISSIAEVQVARNYGFQMMTWDERRYVLSAVTAGIRANWMAAVRRAAGLPSALPSGLPSQDITLTLGEKLERELDSSHHRAEREREPHPLPLPLAHGSGRSHATILFSSDDEYRTASSESCGGCGTPPGPRAGTGAGDATRESTSDWGETVTLSLPPSPPLNRTPISRVKERARSRVCKRSRSSPPSSRRSTLDSVRTEDVVLACCGEMPESDLDDRLSVDTPPDPTPAASRLSSLTSLSSLQETAERQKRELEDMKGQLKLEALRLRQREAESGALDRQVKELLSTLERTEEQLKQRTREAAKVAEQASELDALKDRYAALLREHEALLEEWRSVDRSQDWRGLYQQAQDRYRHDKDVWEQRLAHSEDDLRATAERGEQLARDLETAKASVDELRQRLATGLEENESLYARLHELEGRNTALALSASRERGRSMDSLSDLTNIDLDLRFDELDKERVVEEFEELRGRFEKAVLEIRAMKRELRESHALHDELELSTLALRQEVRRREEAERAQAALMAARVEDLTLKLTAAEKQVRLLKQKLAKAESLKVREKRRSLSLKGRESFQICRELEDKLAELECKLTALEGGGAAPTTPSSPSSPSPTPSLSGSVVGSSRSSAGRTERRRDRAEREKNAEAHTQDKDKSSRLRRKSLDSATSSEPMKVLIRLSALESKVAKAVRQAERQEPVRVNVERVSEELQAEAGAVPSARLVALEDVVLRSRAKMRDCMRLLGRAPPALERCMAELDAVLQETDRDAVSGEARSAVQRLERLLHAKLRELGRRRQALRQAGQLDRRARLELLAEKLAYEAVLVGRLRQACGGTGGELAERRQGVELAEIDRYMSSLQAKLDNETAAASPPGVKASLDHLAKVLSKYLQLQGVLVASQGVKRVEQRQEIAPAPALPDGLAERKAELDAAVERFRREKLDPLATLLAEQTLRMDRDQDGDQEEDRLRDAFRVAQRMAQEAVNYELVQAEISHVAACCAQGYGAVLAAEREATLDLGRVGERAGLELWANVAEQALHTELEAASAALAALYEQRVSELRRSGRSPDHLEAEAEAEAREEDVRRLLAEFADVTAHKALVDARISVWRGDARTIPLDPADDAAGVEVVSKVLDAEAEANNHGLSSSAVSAEFEFLFHKFCGECRLAVGEVAKDVAGAGAGAGTGSLPEEDSCSGEVMWALSDIKEELNRLQDCIQLGDQPEDGHGPRSGDADRSDRSMEGSGCWSWTDICAQCTQLRQQVVSLQSCVLQSQACQRCQQLQQQLDRLESLHGEELVQLRQSQEKEMATLTGELEMQRRSLVCQHEMEQAQLKERARKLERRLDTLDSEYTLQMDNLHSAYQKTLAAGLERDLDSGDNIRQRYQTEIEHLRALCEKGLVAMDNSHRRIIAELEEKHRQEAEQLRLEKEQALAEETQATLAALDAMRKAHEMEVQKEIAKFKAEFIKKMQATHDIGALHKEHEAEMEEIKQEILSLSEKYSVKCLESAALEEQLGLVSKQLAQAQQHILDLDARNKQLRAHLVSEANEDGRSSPPTQLLRETKLSSNCSTVSGSGSSTVSVNSSGASNSSRCSGSSVDSTHGSLGSMDCWSHQTSPQTPALPDPWGLRIKGSRQNISGSATSNGLRAEFLGLRAKSKQRTEPAVLTSAELMRYSRRHCSSLPPLGSSLRSSSPSLSSLSSHSSSPCPLSGMVAERKKMFEQ